MINFYKMKVSSFTLLELIIVVLIVGILVSFAMPGFFGAQQKTIDREARTNLKLIQTAEKTHELEEGQYEACTTGVAANSNIHCNNVLGLDLPPSTANGGNWTYVVRLTGGGTGFTVTATGTKGTQNWTIDEDADEAS
ncbi:MAG: type II secretion system protein [Candidatus Omnitrophota bacterium]